MPLSVAVQMDPIASINPAGDSTFAMMLEAQARGHQLDYYTVDSLGLRDSGCTAESCDRASQLVPGARVRLSRAGAPAARRAPR